jgi:hypothetical protein
MLNLATRKYAKVREMACGNAEGVDGINRHPHLMSVSFDTAGMTVGRGAGDGCSYLPTCAGRVASTLRWRRSRKASPRRRACPPPRHGHNVIEWSGRRSKHAYAGFHHAEQCGAGYGRGQGGWGSQPSSPRSVDRLRHKTTPPSRDCPTRPEHREEALGRMLDEVFDWASALRALRAGRP